MVIKDIDNPSGHYEHDARDNVQGHGEMRFEMLILNTLCIHSMERRRDYNFPP